MGKDWESAKLILAWSVENLSLMYLGVVLYCLLLIFAGYQFVVHVRLSTEKFWSLQKIAYVLVSLFLIDRILYFSLLSVGAIENIPTLGVVFADLPALIFFAVFSLNLARFAEIYHFSFQKEGLKKLKVVIIAFNAVVFVAYIVFLLAFLLISQRKATNTLSCDSILPTATFSSADYVAIVFKAFFLLICLMLAGGFVFYSTKLIRILGKQNAVDKNNARTRKMTRLTVATSICVLSLLAQAVNLLVSVFVTRSTTVILVVVLIVETIPALLFLFLFAYEKSISNPVSVMKAVTISTRDRTKNSLKSKTKMRQSQVNESQSTLKVKKQESQTPNAESRDTQSPDTRIPDVNGPKTQIPESKGSESHTDVNKSASSSSSEDS